MAFEISQRTDDSAIRGTAVVSDTVETMKAIASSVSSASNGIEALGAQSKLISSIVGTISGIAAQTNLLALNAAIELPGRESRVEGLRLLPMKFVS